MFRARMKRLTLSTCLGTCLVSAFIWAQWVQTHSQQNTAYRSENTGIVLPTGFLPTMPYATLKGSVVDLSSERLARLDDLYTGKFELDANGYPILLSDENLVQGNASNGIPKSSSSNDALRKLMPTKSPVSHNPELLQAATFLYNSSFKSIFSSAFRRPEDASAEKEAANPFSEAKQEADKDASSKTAKSDSTASKPATQNTSNPDQRQTADAVGQSGISSPPFLFLGDWEHKGNLEAISASRISDSNFAFPDGQRSFNLLVNYSAVEQQRSIAIDDINGDGIADLLTTGRDGLVGWVLLGDASGAFRQFDSFLTGFEPVVAVPGPYENGLRKIVTVNMRSGEVSWFTFFDRLKQSAAHMLGFIPDYVGNLVNVALGNDYLMIGNLNQPSRSYQILSDNRLLQSADTLPASPSMEVSKDLPVTGNWRVQCFQVGAFASIVLTNNAGQTFNVANLRVTPQVYLAIGDLNNDGMIDVAFAHLQ
jgi:hypothetical protein